MKRSIIVAARDSALSKAQVVEAMEGFPLPYTALFMKTSGDIDKKSSLRELNKTDFFTREIDALLLEGRCDVAIHSAKDLPEPLPKGLKLALLTQGLDPRDSLVYGKRGFFLGAKIGTSSLRREEVVRKLGGIPYDIRGTIEERLKLIDSLVDGLIVAEAALMRLKLELPRLVLCGETAPLQGRLAILVREAEEELVSLFCNSHKVELNRLGSV